MNESNSQPNPEESIDDLGKYNFFSIVHKSIISADFYRIVSQFRLRRVLLFVVSMCIVSAVISGAGYTYYALDKQRGLPALAAAVFPGMALKKGSLDPGRLDAYIPDKAAVAKLLNMLLCMPGTFNDMPDSFVVIDTSAAALAAEARGQILFSRQCIAVKTQSSAALKIAYSKFAPASDTIVFTPEQIGKLLKKNTINLSINFFIQSGIIATVMLWLGIIFLTVIAFLFRIQKQDKIGGYFRKACFAITPIFIGNNLIALSGTHIANAWYLLLMISVFLMFRAVRRDQPAR